MEVMVALFLVALIFTTVNFGGSNDRDLLEESVESIRRAINFSSNEAVLQNKISRVLIKLEKKPQELTVMIGNSSSILVPSNQDDNDFLSIAQKEEKAKINKQFENQFSTISEYADEPVMFDEDISVLGMGEADTDKLNLQTEMAYYSYPSGEREEKIIFISSLEEFAAIKTKAFQNEIDVEYYKYSDYDLQNLNERQEQLMKEFLQKWQKGE